MTRTTRTPDARAAATAFSVRGEIALVASEQGAVDVESEQADARGQRPVQASTFSITSPGRILSTTSIPEATHPNTV